MGKSLTETAKAILSEGAYPSVSPMGAGSPDRDAASSNPNMATLRPGSKGPEATFSNPGADAPNAPDNSVEDLGPALTAQGDVPPSAKASAKAKKDTSKSSQAAVPAEKPKSSAEVMEEEVEISEELSSFIEAMVAEGYSEEQIAEAIEENFEVVSEEVDAIEEETIEEESDPIVEVDMSEHIEALFAGEELSEEFKMKAKTIFEAAVQQKLAEEVALIEEAFAETLEEQVQEISEELTSNVDDYLSYVVEQWVGENEVAIEAGLRTELTEDFISGLRNLFAEHYIDIPEDKISMVEEMGAKVEELEARLNEEIDRNVSLTKVINESKQFEIFVDACEGLTNTQAEKLKALAEGIEFTSAHEYAQKLNIIKESYFAGPVKSEHVLDLVEETEGKPMISDTLSGPMAHYVRTLGKTLPR